MQVKPTHRTTPLFGVHKALGARIIEFAGWQMPVEYEGIIKECLAVRSACGIFDVSHMGELMVRGSKALEFLQWITTNDASRLKDGACQYTLICNDHGGIMDDVILYRLKEDEFLLCVNAVNRDKLLGWLEEKAPSTLTVEDKSDDYALIALQGPRSMDVLGQVSSVEPADIKRFHFSCGRVAGKDALISRTGYTGEDGFELYLSPQDAESVWSALMEEGRRYDIKPCGLGARDVLRIEVGYPLYGKELTEEISPVEAALMRFVHMEKDFIGREAIERRLRCGTEKVLAGFEVEGKLIPRTGYILKKDGSTVGRVTSGTWSPVLERAIGMGYIERGLATPDTPIEVEARGRLHRAMVKKLPFYRPSEKTT